MIYLIATFVSVLLFSAFIVLTQFETSHGVRLLGGLRRRFDRQVARSTFVLRHVDFSAFIGHLVRIASTRIAHDVAHIVLQGVRVLERTLTRAVKYLRTRRAQPEGGQRGSRFADSIAKVRLNLRRSRAMQDLSEAAEEKA